MYTVGILSVTKVSLGIHSAEQFFMEPINNVKIKKCRIFTTINQLMNTRSKPPHELKNKWDEE
jgi:hypothetical protein